MYELHVQQFNDTFDGVVDRLDYLESLGVNCLELMPVMSHKLDFDWGYGPLHYFSPSAHFGDVEGLKHLVDAAHASETLRSSWTSSTSTSIPVSLTTWSIKTSPERPVSQRHSVP